MQNPETPAKNPELEPTPQNAVEAEPSPESPESGPRPEKSGDAPEGEAKEAAAAETPALEVADGPAPEQKDPYRMQVERVLEDNLWDVYKALPAEKRQRFKTGGEKLAAELRNGLEDPKLKAGRVYTDVRAWLKTIPSVNPFFLTQEAKIKTDKWAKLRKEALAVDDDGIEDL